MNKTYGLVIHGGAGAILRGEMTAENEQAYRAKLREAVDAGYAVLDREGSALDAVVAAVEGLRMHSVRWTLLADPNLAS